MDDVTRRSVDVDIGDNKYTLSELDYDAGVEFEKYVRSNRVAIIRDLTGLDAMEKRSMMLEAANSPVDPSELAAEMQTLSGARQLILISLRVAHPEVNEDSIKTLVTLDNYEELLDLANSMSQKDEPEEAEDEEKNEIKAQEND